MASLLQEVRGLLKVPCNLNHSIMVTLLCCLVALGQGRSVGGRAVLLAALPGTDGASRAPLWPPVAKNPGDGGTCRTCPTPALLAVHLAVLVSLRQEKTSESRRE